MVMHYTTFSIEDNVKMYYVLAGCGQFLINEY